MYRYMTVRFEGLLKNVEDNAFCKMDAKLSALPNENWGCPNVVANNDNFREVEGLDGEILNFADTELIFVTTVKWFMVDDVIQRVYEIIEDACPDFDGKFTVTPDGEQKISRSEYEWHHCR